MRDSPVAFVGHARGARRQDLERHPAAETRDRVAAFDATPRVLSVAMVNTSDTLMPLPSRRAYQTSQVAGRTKDGDAPRDWRWPDNTRRRRCKCWPRSDRQVGQCARVAAATRSSIGRSEGQSKPSLGELIQRLPIYLRSASNRSGVEEKHLRLKLSTRSQLDGISRPFSPALCRRT